MKKEDIEKMKVDTRSVVEKAKIEQRSLTPEEDKLVSDNKAVIEFEEKVISEIEKRSLDTGNIQTRSIQTVNVIKENVKISEENKMENDKELESRSICDALLQNRALALGSNGESGFINRIFEARNSRNDILSFVTIDTDALPNTKYPLFSASGLTYVGTSEDGTGSSESNLSFTSVDVVPEPWLAYTHVTDYMLKQNPVSVVGKIGDSFQNYFNRKMANEIIAGVGGEGHLLGVLKDTSITQSATVTGTNYIAGMLGLIAKLSGKFNRNELVIVTSPSYWAKVVAADQKFQHINNVNGTYFDNVRVIECDDISDSSTAGDTVAMVGFFKDYGIAIAHQLELETLPKAVGSLKIPIQGVAYLDGKTIVPSSFAKLINA